MSVQSRLLHNVEGDIEVKAGVLRRSLGIYLLQRKTSLRRKERKEKMRNESHMIRFLSIEPQATGKKNTGMEMTSAPARVPSQRPLSPSFTSVTFGG